MIFPGRPKRSKTTRPSGAGAAPPASSPEGAAPPASSPEGAAPPASSPDGAAPHFVARLVPLEPGFYVFSLAGESGWREPVVGLALPALQVCAAPRQAGPHGTAAEGGVEGGPEGGIEITDSFGRAGSWLGGRHKVLFVKSPAGGGAALVTGYLARDPDGMSLDLDIRRVGPPAPKNDGEGAGAEGQPTGGAAAPPPAPVMTLRLGGPAAAARSPQPTGLDVVAHIRGRGDVRFLDTPWVGRLGPGSWIEGFMIFPHSRSAAAAVEYKGLTASGAETPWISSGALCGARGRGIPLVGFAVRQKAVPGGALVDCEYTGYFQSGATAGPARNGAPCRSATDNDPLEGMQLRITPRQAPPVPAKTG